MSVFKWADVGVSRYDKLLTFGPEVCLLLLFYFVSTVFTDEVSPLNAAPFFRRVVKKTTTELVVKLQCVRRGSEGLTDLLIHLSKHRVST